MSDLPPPDGLRPTDPTTAMPATGSGPTPPPYPPATPGTTPPAGTIPAQSAPSARPPGQSPQPPRSGVSTGIVVTVSVLVAVIGFLAGALIFGGDDDGTDSTEPVLTTPADGSEDLAAQVAALTEERDQLVAQVDELTTQLESTDGDSAELRDQIEQLQTDVDTVTAERDDLRAQLDAIGEEVVPAHDLVDGTVEAARDAADEAGWELIERDATDVPDGTAPGTVVAQVPEPETAMVEGSVLIIDLAPEPAGG